MDKIGSLIVALVGLFGGLDGVAAAFEIDAGADLRIRHELMKHVPGLPGGGYLSTAKAGSFKNQMRFRPRVWFEVKAFENWRLYTRLTDEFRWNPEPYSNKTTFPDEVIIDNLYLEGKDLLDGVLDLSIGRQDIYNYCGLDHVFVDGTPGDGSRTVYSDMVKGALKITKDTRLDFFMLHNCDDNVLRWGTKRGKHRALSGLSGSTDDPEMDDWGWGWILSAKAADWLPFQIFSVNKITESFWLNGKKHPWTYREMYGVKVMPRLTEEWSLQFEAMGQMGENDDEDFLSGWSTYAGVNWREAGTGAKMFGSLGFHTMSGDKDAANQDGGHHGWDPMWSRGVNDSEIFLYGTHYGMAWWSNMMFLKLTGGIDLGKRHKLTVSTGPMFATVNDDLGGGDGNFKGMLSVARYDFPIWTADAAKGERFEVFGHLYAELFNPGDYFETDKPAWFVRWQIDFKF